MKQEQSITLSERAVKELKDLIKESKGDCVSLRVWVAGGGCRGLNYGMALDTEKPEENDKIITQEGIRILVDPLSYQYIVGSEVDYIDDLMGGGFKVNNPNAVSCGCGSSFSFEDDDYPIGGCGGCKYA